jgi:heptosyltransferase-2
MSLLTVPARLAESAGRSTLHWLATPQAAHVIGEPLFWLLGMRRKGREIDLSQVKRLLVVRLDEIGDVVLTTPFLGELRRNLPDAWITLVVKPQAYNLVELCPYVNEVLTYDWRVNGRFTNLRRHWRALRLAWRHLWRRRFDLAILPRWDTDGYHGTFVLYFSGASWRVGYSETVNDHKRRANKGFNRLLTHPLQDSNLKHEVEHNLDVIRFLGGQVQDDRLELWLGKKDKGIAEQFLKDHQVEPDELLVGLAPGAGAPKRMWPIKRFAELGSWLRNAYGARLLIVGGPGEEPLGEELERALGASVVNAVGRTTLRQAAALLQHCQLFVGNDAGPMHMAAAVGVPVVELSCHPELGSPYSASSPLRFGPWGVSHTVVQPQTSRPPCVDECIADHPHCILGITVDQVKEAVTEGLARRKKEPGNIKERGRRSSRPVGPI